MTVSADFLLLVVVALSLSIVATSRLTTCVRASALQGVALARCPSRFGAGRSIATWSRWRS